MQDSHKNTDSKIQRGWPRSVCFTTETPVNHIYIQFEKISGRQYPFQKYGLAFFEEAVRQKNRNPIMYFNSQNKYARESLDSIPVSNKCEEMKYILPFYEGFGPRLFSGSSPSGEVDFRWEREWRIAGNFSYCLKNDMAFGICPYSEINKFENLVFDNFQFIDPSPKYLEEMKEKLRLNDKIKELIS